MLKLTSMLISAILLVAPAIAQETVASDPNVRPVVDTLAGDTTGVDTLASGVSGAVIIDDDGEQIYPMSPERQEKLVSYSKFNSIWRFVSFLISLLVPGLILFTGWSARLRDWSKRVPYKFFAMWLYLVLFLLTDYIMSLPFTIYRSFIVESNYGFMNQSFIGWWGEDMLGLLITAVFMIVPVWFFYWLVNRLQKWWLWFTAGMIPFMILMVVVIPIWIQPLFNQYGSLQDKELETEILALASQAGIEGADVFEVDASKQSDKINAYVTGLFGTKRIVLYDTLIKGFTTDEIRFVMAHEMGHYVKNHIWQGLAVGVLFVMFLLWLTGRLIPGVIRRYRDRFRFDTLGDYASWPLVLIFLSVGSFVFQPVTNMSSRWMEHQCDIYGMEMSGVDGDTAATAFEKLSVFNLSDPDPNPIIEFWFYSHPALNKRMEFVRQWQPEVEKTIP